MAGCSASFPTQWLLLTCLSAGLAGCQFPAARFAARDTGDWDPPCALALTKQLVADSTVQCACDPLHSAWALIYESADHLLAFGHGEFAKRVLLPLHGHPGPIRHNGPLLARAAEASLPHDALPAQVCLHTEGADALVALERLIDQAQASIDVLMFEWENDEIGRRIANRLAARAGPNVRIRLLVDGSSNLVFAHPETGKASEANGVLCGLAAHANIQVLRCRNPFGRFDHRKLVLVDGISAWTGGRDLMRRAFLEDHDLSITLHGPLVAALQRSFEQCWSEQGGDPREPAAPARAEPVYNAWGRIIETKPGKHQLQHALYKAVDDARHYIYVENVYFTDSRLAYKLAKARRRGVDVRVVMTLDSNCTPINRGARVLANRLWHAGVRVYLYPGTTHVKAALVDGNWAYVGTANFDPLSLRHNRELGLAFCAGPVIADLEERLFLPDFKDEWELREPLPVAAVDYLCEVIGSLWL
jgi:cardiolipin synthase A/B